MRNPFEKLDGKTALNLLFAIGTGVVAVVTSMKEQEEKAELDEMRTLFREFKAKENK